MVTKVEAAFLVVSGGASVLDRAVGWGGADFEIPRMRVGQLLA